MLSTRSNRRGGGDLVLEPLDEYLDLRPSFAITVERAIPATLSVLVISAHLEMV